MPNIHYYIYACAMALLLAGCSAADEAAADGGNRGTLLSDSTYYDGPTADVKLYLALPSATTRVGDPGTATEETDDWDRVTLFVAYDASTTPNDGKVVRTVTFSHDDYDGMATYNGTIKTVKLSLPEGQVRVYGFTYSSGATLGFQPEELTTEAAVKDCQISNAYSTDAQKFCSVATGYYIADGDNEPGTIDLAKVSQSNTSPYEIPVMTLTRLAAKLDVQWDAKSAYDNSYTNVKVTGFTYDGGATYAADSEKAGYGRLFPTLATNTQAKGGQISFVNQTEISKRNGRSVHYIFPDGAKGAKVTFNVTSQHDDTTQNHDYSLAFTNTALQQATWYKINATIVGNSGQTSVNSVNF